MDEIAQFVIIAFFHDNEIRVDVHRDNVQIDVAWLLSRRVPLAKIDPIAERLHVRHARFSRSSSIRVAPPSAFKYDVWRSSIA